MSKTVIKTDGTFKLAKEPKFGTSILYASGTLGSATVKIVVANGDNTFSDFEDGAITATQTQYIVEHGVGVKLYLKVSGADSATNLVCNVAGLS